MTLPRYNENSIFAHRDSTDEQSASQSESTTIPQWLQIFESDPRQLAMFAATQLRWTPSFVEGVEGSKKIYSGEITSLTFNGRGVIADQALVQGLSVLVQACHIPLERLFGKPSNIELATAESRRAVIRYSEGAFIEFKIGENNTITAQAQGMRNFDFPRQEVLEQIREHGSRFMSSTGLVSSIKQLVSQNLGQSVLISPKLIGVMMDAVSKQTNEHWPDGGSNENRGNNNIEKNLANNHDLLSSNNNRAPNACDDALRCINHPKPAPSLPLHSSTAPILSRKGVNINCSPYLLGNMISAVYNVRQPFEYQTSVCVA